MHRQSLQENCNTYHYTDGCHNAYLEKEKKNTIDYLRPFVSTE